MIHNQGCEGERTSRPLVQAGGRPTSRRDASAPWDPHRGALCLFLFLALCAFRDLPAQRYPMRHYGPEEGLRASALPQLFQDRLGYLWTTGDTYQYDGFRFTDIETDLNAFVLSVDAQGYVYLSADQGIWRVAGNERVLIPYKSLGRPWRSFHGIRKGEIWFWHRSNADRKQQAGLSRLVDGRLTEYPDPLYPMGNKSDAMSGLTMDSKGQLLFCNRDQKNNRPMVHRFYDGVYKDVLGEIGLAPAKDVYIYNATADDAGGLWLFANRERPPLDSEKITYRYINGKVLSSPPSDGVALYPITQHYTGVTGQAFMVQNPIDTEGYLWLLGDRWNEETRRYDPVAVARARGDRVTYLERTLLPPGKLIDVQMNPDRSVWIFTTGGFARFDGSRRTMIRTGLSLREKGHIHFLYDTGGTMYIGESRQDQKTRLPDAEGVRLFVVSPSGEVRTYDKHSGLLGDGIHNSLKSSADLYAEPFRRDSYGVVWFTTDKALFSIHSGKLVKHDLPAPSVSCALFDKEGMLWVSTPTSLTKISTARESVQYTEADGLPETGIDSVPKQAKDGTVWVVSKGKLVSVRDGAVNVIGAEKERVITNELLCDSRGNVWYATDKEVKRFDGNNVVTVAQAPWVWKIIEDRQGRVWWSPRPDGVQMFFNGKVTALGPKDGLVTGWINEIREDQSGVIWFVSPEVGVSRYDGTTFTNYTTANGAIKTQWWSFTIDKQKRIWLRDGGTVRCLSESQPVRKFEVDPEVTGLREFWDIEENLWLKTGAKLFKIGPRETKSYTAADGAPVTTLTQVAQDPKGRIWTFSWRGVHLFDPQSQRFRDWTTAFGGPSIVPSRREPLFADGAMWFGSVQGLIRVDIEKLLRPSTRPRLQIRSIEAGDKKYGMNERVVLSPKNNNLLISYGAISFRNERGVRYTTGLSGHDNEYYTTDQRNVRYTNLPPGDYEFFVQAQTGDGVLSNPVSLKIKVLPPFWRTWWFMALQVIAAIALIYALARLRFKWKLRRARVENELQAAREMQLSLMPTNDPIVDGFDVSGTCVPAYEVGGDFFDYIWLDEAQTRLGIVVGDVSGKAMKAAMFAVMTSGIVHGELDGTKAAAEILRRVNRRLYEKTPRNVFTAMAIVILDTRARTLTMANAGQLPPILKRGTEVRYLTVEGPRLPLGARKQIDYQELTVDLLPGDVVIVHTDGLTEAMNDKDEMFDPERVEQVLSNGDDKNAAAFVASLVGAARGFSGATGYQDDIAVVVIRVKELAAAEVTEAA